MWIESSELKWNPDDDIVITRWLSNNAQVTMRRLSPQELGGAPLLLDMRPLLSSFYPTSSFTYFLTLYTITLGNSQQRYIYCWHQQLHLWLFFCSIPCQLKSRLQSSFRFESLTSWCPNKVGSLDNLLACIHKSRWEGGPILTMYYNTIAKQS